MNKEPMSTGRSTTTYSRTPSVKRPMPQLNPPSNVSTISRSIQSGSMNITPANTVRARPLSSVRQKSIDRSNISIKNIPTSALSTQRRISTDTTRSRLSNQEQSVSRSNMKYLSGKREMRFFDFINNR
jgi:hypothetical protein